MDIWKSVKNGYKFPKVTPVEPEETTEKEYTIPRIAPVELEDRTLYECNAKEKNEILCGLVDVEFLEVMQCTIAKDIWDNLKSIYEGDEKVKKTKL